MKISVALCTYGGVDYIQEQLQSIIKQTVLPYEIVICDDGSTDGTIQVIEDFSKTSPVPIELFQNNVTLGVVKNFEQAIGYCSGDYIALSDQDDVWKQDKLEICVAKLRELQKGTDDPVLIHTDLVVVDEDLHTIAPSLMRYQGMHHESNAEQAQKVLLFQNFVTGCTVIFNKALKEKAIPFPEHIVMHDWWLAIIAAFIGTIGYVDQSTVYYRQHNNNCIGAKENGWKGFIHKLLAWKKIKRTVQDIITQSMSIPTEATQCSAWIQKYWDSMRNGDLRTIWSLGIHKQNPIKNIIFYLILWFEYK